MDTGFDDPGIFFSDNFGSEDQNNEDQINRTQVKKRFKDFIRQFHEGNFSYRYRLVFFASSVQFFATGNWDLVRLFCVLIVVIHRNN